MASFSMKGLPLVSFPKTNIYMKARSSSVCFRNEFLIKTVLPCLKDNRFDKHILTEKSIALLPLDFLDAITIKDEFGESDLSNVFDSSCFQ